MKAVKMKLNMDVVNCVLLVVILALVIYCVVKQNEGFEEYNPSQVKGKNIRSTEEEAPKYTGQNIYANGAGVKGAMKNMGNKPQRHGIIEMGNMNPK